MANLLLSQIAMRFLNMKWVYLRKLSLGKLMNISEEPIELVKRTLMKKVFQNSINVKFTISWHHAKFYQLKENRKGIIKAHVVALM